MILPINERFENLELAVPRPVGLLQHLDGTCLFHESHGARYPLAAYNLSITVVASRLISLMEILAAMQAAAPFNDIKNVNWDVPLVEAIDHVLDAMMEHMEVCNGILRSFFLPSEEAAYKIAIRKFKRSVEPYGRHIGTIVNCLKHAQGQIRIVLFTWPVGSSLGYFIEGPIKGGGVGPLAEIHPNENTAFSFNRNIPFHICNLFAIGARLAAAIRRRIVQSPPHESAQMALEPSSKLQRAISLCSQLSDIYFPDEVSLPMPHVKIWGENVMIELPNQVSRPRHLPPNARLSVFFGGDGVTKTYKIPYFQVKTGPSLK